MSRSAPLRDFVDRLYFMDKNLTAHQFKGNYTPMQARILQSVCDDIDAGKPPRKRILKARQMGCSTLVQAIMFAMAMMVFRTRGLVVSHEQSSAEHLLGINAFYYDTFWAKNAFTPKHLATNKLSWRESNSLITIATAKSVGSARSQTIHFLHASECAFWPDPAKLLTGLNQAIPRANPLAMVFHESTANGVGNWWHRAWKSAVSGDDDFDALFFGWQEHPEYRASAIGLGHLLSSPLVPTDDEERALIRYLRRHFSDTETHDKLLWRREYIRTECLGDMDKFHQEYPTTPEEAFISSGTNVFPLNHLRAAYEPELGETGDLKFVNGRITWIPNPRGPIRVFRKPDTTYGSQYLIGGDPAFSAMGDYACGQIINRATWEQVAIIREKIDAVSFAEKLELLGRWYNDAIIAVEATKAGGASVGALRAKNYPNIWVHQKVGNIRGQLSSTFGWVTNWQTKNEAISNLQKATYDSYIYKDRGMGLLIHDQWTYEEMKGYVVIEGGQAGNQNSYGFGNSDGTDHDDTVMALAIALTCTMYEAGSMPMNEGPAMLPQSSARADNRAITEFERQLEPLGVGEGAVMTDRGLLLPGPSPWLDGGGQEDMLEESDWEG